MNWKLEKNGEILHVIDMDQEQKKNKQRVVEMTIDRNNGKVIAIVSGKHGMITVVEEPHNEYLMNLSREIMALLNSREKNKAEKIWYDKWVNLVNYQ